MVENYGPHPIRFDSHTERRKYMAEHGLREKEQWAPMPGTDKDPQGIPNPKGFIDAKTMDNARVLLSRGRRPTIEDFDDLSEPYSSAIEPFNNVGDNIAARMTLASATSKRDE